MTSSLFCKFLCEKVVIIFWKSEAKLSKLFQSKVRPRRYFWKWFRNYLDIKKECSEHLKMAFLSNIQISQ